jgi:hypothetical protein
VIQVEKMSTHQPHWNSLIKIFALAVALLALVTRVHLTPAAHRLVLLAIVVLVFGQLGLWVQSNELEIEDQPAGARRREIWRAAPVEWNNGKEEVSDGIDRLEDERSFDPLRI